MELDSSTLALHWVARDQLFCSPANPRVNDQAVPHVAASLRRFGWRQPIVAKRSGEVIAGNTRLKAAGELGLEQVPVAWFEGDDIEATAYAIADNRTGEFAEWDQPSLAALLTELREEDALSGVGFDEAQIDELLAELGQSDQIEGEDPGAQEPPKTPFTKEGDLWLLGKHRLLCGDSTRQIDFERLMDGQRAALLATDPPYFVGYQGAEQKAGKTPPEEDHWDTFEGAEHAIDFYRSFLAATLSHCVESVPVYHWHAHKRQMLVEKAWEGAGLKLHQQIIWTKPRGVFTRSHFMWQHEPCFYGWPAGKMPENGRRPSPGLTTVWEIDGSSEESTAHPTQKPLRIFEIPIEQHTKPGEIVLEPFLGSGSQLMAAERLGRRCFAVEKSPSYVDAVILRWQLGTGQVARHAETGEPFRESPEEAA